MLLAATVLVACAEPAPATVTLKGDSLVNVVHMTFAGGASSSECAFSVEAMAAGPKDSKVTLTKGRVIYTLLTGDTMMKRPIEGAAVADFFEGGSPQIMAGGKITSKRQGLSVSNPPQPLRGFVTFDFTVGDSRETKTSSPYTFVCR